MKRWLPKDKEEWKLLAALALMLAAILAPVAIGTLKLLALLKYLFS